MINFGKISTVLLLGGGELMYYFAKIAKKNKLKVISVIAPRHAKEVIADKKNLESLLREEGLVFKFDKIDKKKIKNILGENKDILYFSFDSPWIFNNEIIKDLFKNKLINSHSTRLPQNRGGGGFSWRILNQEKFGICLIHLISEEEIDKGEIVLHKNFLFPHSLKKPLDYYSFQLKEEKNFLSEFLEKLLCKKNFDLIAQPEYLSTYFPRLSTNTNGWIDWSLKNIDLFNFICAFDDPYEGASTKYGSKKVRIKSVTWSRSDQIFHPYQYGMIYRKTEDWIVVAINSGSLIIEEVLNEKNENIINKLIVGNRFLTEQYLLEAAKVRKFFTPLGLK
jgi:methionyl-tRNA formyltransferase